MATLDMEYDSFDEQDEKFKKDTERIVREAEAEARRQGIDALKRMRDVKTAESGTAAGTSTGAATGSTASGILGSSTASSMGASFGAGTSAGSGIAVLWKVLLIFLAVLILIAVLYFLISAVIQLANQLRDARNPEIPEEEQSVNNAAYVLSLIENGEISLETGTAGAFDNDYAIRILTAVLEEKEAREESITVSYEGKPWVLVKDAEGNALEDERFKNPDGVIYQNEYGFWQESVLQAETIETTLSRRDLESFSGDSFADPYELRWQSVYALSVLKVTGSAREWGLTEELTVSKMNEEGVSDYFLKDLDLDTCIDCFKPHYTYYWNPLREIPDGTVFTYDDARMKAYLVEDGRDNPVYAEDTGCVAYVFQKPVAAASEIDLGYKKIRFIVRENGEYVITSKIIEETPEEWMEKLSAAAGGYFDKERFLYLLSHLPGTEDLVKEYREVFQASDGEEVFNVDECIVLRRGGTILPSVSFDTGSVTGLNFAYQMSGSGVLLDFRDCYICQGDKNWRTAPRGAGTTIGTAGCVDCCFAMASWYYNRSCLPMQVVSTRYVDGNDWFLADAFCRDFGINRGGQDVNYFPTDAVKKHIDSGNPVIFKIKGTWIGERKYHGGSATHFILVCGYDERGIFVCDPGNPNNNGPLSIPYEDMEKAPVTFINFLTSGASGRFLKR